jgi:hypothetical protein
MESNEIISQDTLSNFIHEYVTNRCCLEILRFFGAYPNIRFNQFAIINVMSEGGNKPVVKKALDDLIGKGVIIYHVENNESVYSLTGCESIRTQVLQLGNLEWHEWQLILTSSFLTS